MIVIIILIQSHLCLSFPLFAPFFVYPCFLSSSLFTITLSSSCLLFLLLASSLHISSLLSLASFFKNSADYKAKVADSFTCVTPLVTGASREQGIVGCVMAEQLFWGQGSEALTTACCLSKGGDAVVSRAAKAKGFVMLPNGAWRWENWGRGQSEIEEIRNEMGLTKREG